MKKLGIIFCMLFCFISSSKVHAEFYPLNFMDSASLQDLLKANPKVYQHLKKIEPQWEKIFKYAGGKTGGCNKLYYPFKGMSIIDFWGTTGQMVVVNELDLSQYRINTVVKNFIVPEGFWLLDARFDFSNTNLQRFYREGPSSDVKLNNNLLTKWEGTYNMRNHLEVRYNNISVPFTEFSRSGTNQMLQGNLEHLDISNNFIGHKTSTKASDNISTNFISRSLYRTLYIDISCNGFRGNMFSDEPKRALEIAKGYKLRERRKQGQVVRFIATAKRCLPGRKHNVFTNQDVMEQYGFEFGKKEHVITQGVRDKLISQGQGDLLKQYESESQALTPKENKYYSKVSQKIRDMVGRFISRFQQRLRGKTKTEIFEIKKSELHRIAAIAKKYIPLSKTDEYMLRYLWEEIRHVQAADNTVTPHGNGNCTGRYKKYFLTQRDCRGGLCYDHLNPYFKHSENGALKVCDYLYFCKNKQGDFVPLAKEKQDRGIMYSGQKLYDMRGACFRYNVIIPKEFVRFFPYNEERPWVGSCVKDRSSPTFYQVEK